MAKEHWYFIGGVLVVLLPLILLVVAKKLHWLEIRPDQKIIYATNAGQALTLHAFHAKQRPDNAVAPALLLFHGGRWLYGNPEDYYPQCKFFAERGVSCFSAQYRLGTNNRPDVRGALADARAALDYLITHAAALRINPHHIAVGGASAGGHLAAALGSGLPHAATAASPEAKRPAAQVLYNPMLDLAPGTPDHHLVKDYWQDVSPYHHIDDTVPPALILVGSQDLEVPVPTAQAFCTAVEGAGGRCEIALYDGASHGFFRNPPYLEQTNRRVLEFLQKYTRG
jgi:acetyl esterase/lipase